MNDQTERDYWLPFLHKFVFLNKEVGNDNYLYRGEIVAVLEDKLIINDVKIGEIPLSFKGLSITGVKNGNKQ